MQRKKKECKKCHKDRYLFGRGYCTSCYRLLFTNPIKVRTTINPISKKMTERRRLYKEKREEYLLDHHICECCKERKATQIHHKRGRDGDNLFNHFLAVCAPCHRKIEDNPEWARENNYTESRLK